MKSFLKNSFFSKKVTVAVHDGSFHPDDVFAVAILSLYIQKPIRVIRTREQEILNTCDYVCDVGGEYNPTKNRFDHHQVGYDEKRNNGIVYSSAGLVWKEFGEKVAGSPEIARRIDKKIMQGIDAIDNGIELYRNNFESVFEYTFGNYISSLNPTYTEKNKNSLKIFLYAVREAKKVLMREMQCMQDNLSTEKIVRGFYDRAEDKRIIVLDDDYPWESVISEYPEPLFVVRPVAGGERWNVKRVPLEASGFKNRLDLPESWAGKKDAELQKASGVSDALFCHRSRFIAGAKSKEGAIALAKIAIEL